MIGSRWISLDPPPRRSGRLGSSEIKRDPAGSGPTRSAPRPRRRRCYSEHPRVGGTSDPTQLDWIPRSRHFCCPGSRQRCTCTQLRESHRIFSDLGNSSRSAVNVQKNFVSVHILLFTTSVVVLLLLFNTSTLFTFTVLTLPQPTTLNRLCSLCFTQFKH